MIRNEDTAGSAFFLSGQYLKCNFFFVMGVQQLYTLINNSKTGASASSLLEDGANGVYLCPLLLM